MAGISWHSAQKQMVLDETPSHFATAAVLRSGSRFCKNFSMVRTLRISLEEHFFPKKKSAGRSTQLDPQNSSRQISGTITFSNSVSKVYLTLSSDSLVSC